MSKGQSVVLWIFGLIIAVISLLSTSLPGVIGFFVILGALFFISFRKKEK